MNHTRIGPGHILIGLIQDKGETGNILAGQGVNLEAVQQAVIEQTPDTEKAGPQPGQIDLLETTQRLLEQAVSLSRQFHHDVIDSGHLLLALVEQDDRRTQTILAQSGLDKDKIRERTRQYLSGYQPSRELDDLLDTLQKLRHLLSAELTPEDTQHLYRIESILQEYFRQ
jgi:ATP-dependent Clp protease ATP-binding subunit ClpA